MVAGVNKICWFYPKFSPKISGTATGYPGTIRMVHYTTVGAGIIFSLCTRTTHTHVILYSNNKNKNNTLLLLPGHPGTNTLVMSTVLSEL